MQQQLKTSNFGKSKGGAVGTGGVGYKLLDRNGQVVVPRTTNGVYESAPGIYGAIVNIPDNFIGQIIWDTGTHFPEVFYASEEVKIMHADDITQSLSIMMSDISFLRAMTAGRWKITDDAHMVFYGEDNVTEVAKYELKDMEGKRSVLSTFERLKI